MAKGKFKKEEEVFILTPEKQAYYKRATDYLKETGETLDQTRKDRIFEQGYARYETWRILPENRPILEQAWQEGWFYPLRDSIRAMFDLEAAWKICDAEFSKDYISFEILLKEAVKPKYRTKEEWQLKQLMKECRVSRMPFFEFPAWTIELLQRQADKEKQVRIKNLEADSKAGMGLSQMLVKYAPNFKVGL